MLACAFFTWTIIAVRCGFQLAMQGIVTEQAHNETHWHENAKEGDD